MPFGPAWAGVCTLALLWLPALAWPRQRRRLEARTIVFVPVEVFFHNYLYYSELAQRASWGGVR